jgi:hypothetical protein
VMRVEIASSCKSLWGNFQLGCTKTRRETNSLMALLITIAQCTTNCDCDIL